jgi:outer membrane receptor for ferrienterochelin and colicin
MNAVCRVALAAAVAAVVAVPSFARQAPSPAKASPAQPASGSQDPAAPEAADPTYEETVVVSGSRVQEKLVNTPVTMTVIGPRQIESATSQNFAELLRSVPGLNITQTSARDINVTSRAATGTLATGQLALLDGRSLYQDFFGFVMWDFLPVNLNEIKQIEVIRGPASAVWGANAVNGVINVITKTPREMQGTSATFGLGTFERTGGEDSGSLWYVSGTHAAAINNRWAFKLSAGGYVQDPLSRPTGFIPGSPATAASPSGTPYPAYKNTGTSQPKFDGRLDYDFEDGRRLSFTGGVSGTEGIMHTGIGPFDINSGSLMSYGRVNFARKGLRVSAFSQMLDGDAGNLLTRDPAGRPIGFVFNTKTSDVDVANVQTLAKRHVLSYGGNLRYNKFDLSLAPNGDNRTEFGIYAQDEIFLSDHFRLTVGGRGDRFDYLDSFVFSPRVALLLKPAPNHTFRLSYNRAYRSPSVINNFLNITIAERLTLGPGLVYPLPVRSVGNPDLT